MRLIDADKLIEKMHKLYDDIYIPSCYDYYTVGVDDAIKEVQEASTAYNVKHGHWDMKTKKIERDGFVLKGAYPTCSVCGYTTVEFCMGFKFCPDCGSKMDEVSG